MRNYIPVVAGHHLIAHSEVNKNGSGCAGSMACVASIAPVLERCYLRG
ncbi:TPA: hypothetical protein HA270_01955 [Candidatus Woesearchaeota archaeon]|nr:hypothetical protein [Candidatus Woesearchaeota archaeon]